MTDGWDLLEQDRRDQEREDAANRARRGILTVEDAVENFAEASAKLAAWKPWEDFPERDILKVEQAIEALRVARAWEVELNS